MHFLFILIKDNNCRVQSFFNFMFVSQGQEAKSEILSNAVISLIVHASGIVTTGNILSIGIVTLYILLFRAEP